MAYRIKRREAIGSAVKRIVVDELEAARREAVDDRRSLEERVHAVRTHLKKARAALRLVRARADGRLRREERALRDLGRSLAPARDGAIARQTLRALGAKGRASRPRVRDEHDLQRGVAQIERLRPRADRFAVEGAGRAARRAFAREYRRARRYLETLQPDDATARFHALRKMVKRLALQARLLERVAPGLSRALQAPLEHLGDHLGDLHDLAVVEAKLATAGGAELVEDTTPEALEDLLGRLRAQAAERRAEARSLGARALSMRPRDVRKRLRREWRVSA